MGKIWFLGLMINELEVANLSYMQVKPKQVGEKINEEL